MATNAGFAPHTTLDRPTAILFPRAMAKNPTLTSIPNLLTYGRIVAIPVIVLLVVADVPALRWLALLLYLAAAVTDYLDGYLARKWNQSSPLGQMLDPIADKLLIGALIVVFAWDRASVPAANSGSICGQDSHRDNR